MPLSQLHYKQHRGIQPSRAQQLDWISVLSYLLPSPPQAERIDLFGSPAPKQLQWHLANRACRCLILGCFVAGEMNAQPEFHVRGNNGEKKTWKAIQRMQKDGLPARKRRYPAVPPTTGTWPWGGSQNLSKKRKKQAKLWKLPSPPLVCLLARAQLVIDFFGGITGLETSENVGMWELVQKDADP